MVDFIFKRSIFSIREMAFGKYSDTSGKKCDVVYMHSNDTEDLSNNSSSCFSEKQYTLENDLTLSEEDICLLFRKTYRNEMRRAEKDAATVDFFDRNSDNINQLINSFEETYNSMFDSKNMSNRFNRAIVEAGIKAGQLLISVCESNDKRLKVFHAYLYDKKRTVLMYSASPLWEDGDKDAANQIGRMNKYLHWMDMKYFKNKGCEVYEWGGINDVESPNGIAKFKMGFGGDVRTYYNYTVARSLLGRLYVYLVKRKTKHE